MGKKNWKQIQVIWMLQFLLRHYFGLYDLQLPLLSSDNSSFFFYKSPQGIIQKGDKEFQFENSTHLFFFFLALITLFLFKTRLFLISCSTGEFSFTLYRGKVELRVFFEKKKKKKGNRWRIVVSSSNKM